MMMMILILMMLLLPLQFPWEEEPTPVHDHTMPIQRYFMDKNLVTCTQYQQYLHDSGYMPTDTHNFLRNWNWSSSSASGIDASREATSDASREATSGSSGAGTTSPRSYTAAAATAETINTGGTLESIEIGDGAVPLPSPPTGYAMKPVAYVSLAEARAYCRHYGESTLQTLQHCVLQALR
jgi:formylglycine-generating enzyme required for sulfatase activity